MTILSNSPFLQAPACRRVQIWGPTGMGMNDAERIAQLEKEIDELRARLPRHSVPMAMMIALEELEEELKALKARAAQHGTRSGDL